MEKQKKLRVKQAIIVEGKYDKSKLSELIDGVILPTDGFTVFKDRDKLALIRHFAKTTGIIILTDSDAAGFQIRSFLKGAVDDGEMKHVYIPDVLGKERRKTKRSAEGKLGVEGMSAEVLRQAFERAGIQEDKTQEINQITKQELYAWGLSGGENSRCKREALKNKLGLPQRLSTNALLSVLPFVTDRQQLLQMINEIKTEECL